MRARSLVSIAIIGSATLPALDTPMERSGPERVVPAARLAKGDVHYSFGKGKHPQLGNYELPPQHMRDLLKSFTIPSHLLNVSLETKRHDVLRQLQTHSSELPWNLEQISRPTFTRDYWNDINLNSDLLAVDYLRSEKKLQAILRLDPITTREVPKFVIASHGHAPALLDALCGMQSTTGAYLFEPSIYAPLGGWGETYGRTNVFSDHDSLMWLSNLAKREKIKRDQKSECLGGIALALNGHRGDLDILTDSTGKDELGQNRRANISSEKLFKSFEGAKRLLYERGIKEVILLTEHHQRGDDLQVWTVADLKQGIGRPNELTFDDANKDLIPLLAYLEDHGFSVKIVACDGRFSGGNATHARRMRDTIPLFLDEPDPARDKRSSGY